MKKNAIRQVSLCSIGRLHGTGVIVPKKLSDWREFSGPTQAKALPDRIPGRVIVFLPLAG